VEDIACLNGVLDLGEPCRIRIFWKTACFADSCACGESRGHSAEGHAIKILFDCPGMALDASAWRSRFHRLFQRSFWMTDRIGAAQC